MLTNMPMTHDDSAFNVDSKYKRDSLKTSSNMKWDLERRKKS